MLWKKSFENIKNFCPPDFFFFWPRSWGIFFEISKCWKPGFEIMSNLWTLYLAQFCSYSADFIRFFCICHQSAQIHSESDRATPNTFSTTWNMFWRKGKKISFSPADFFFSCTSIREWGGAGIHQKASKISKISKNLKKKNRNPKNQLLGTV